MTEDYAIQQDRKQGNYAVPGLILGGATGGIAGVAGAHYKNWGVSYDKPSEEQIAKMFEQKPDDFNGKIERSKDDIKAFYESAQAELKKVNGIRDDFNTYKKELEERVSESSYDQLPKGNKAGDEFRTAKTNYENKLEQLVKEEERKLGGGKGTVTSLPTAEEMRLGIKGDDASVVGKDWESYTTKLEPEYRAARSAVESTATEKGHNEYAKAKAGKQTYKTAVDGYYEDIANAAKETDAAKRKKALADAEVKLETLVEREFKERPKSELLEEAFKAGKMRPRKGEWAYINVIYTDSKGNEYVFKEGESLKKLEKAEKERVALLREELANEIRGAQEAYTAAVKDMNAFETRTEFRKLSKRGNPNTAYVCDVAEIKNDGIIDELTRDLNKANKKKVTQAEIDALKTKYHLDKSIYGKDDLVSNITKRIDLARDYQSLNRTVESSIGGQSRIAMYEAEMEKAMLSNDTVKRRADAIKRLAKKYGINVEGGATDVSAEARANAEKAIAELDVAKILKEKTAAADAELKNLGLSGTKLSQEEIEKLLRERFGAVTADDAAKAVKETAMKTLKEKAEKCKIANKTWTGLAIGGGLALVGALIGYACKSGGDQA